MSSACTGRVVVVSPHRSPGPGPLLAVPSGWTVDRAVADDLFAHTNPLQVTDGDLVVALGAAGAGVRIAAATGARLVLAEVTERKIVLPRTGEESWRSVVLPGVALDRHDPQPVLTHLVCRSPHQDALRVFSDDGRSSRTLEVVLDTGDPLELQDGPAAYRPQPTPWAEPAQVVADGGGAVEAVIDAGRAQRARRLRIEPAAFRFRLVVRT